MAAIVWVVVGVVAFIFLLSGLSIFFKNSEETQKS